MSHQQYLDTATQAMAAGWTPTEAYDESGRPLWVQPGDEGLAPLDAFLSRHEHPQAA